MNGRKVKRIKKEVYGENSPRHRRYYFKNKWSMGQIFADPLRQKYQAAKKEAMK